jgi:hypothetical protein
VIILFPVDVTEFIASPVIVSNHMCHGFMTRFESRGAHGCEGQWYARDTRV